MQSCITIDSTGYDNVKEFKLICGKKTLDRTLITKYKMVIDESFIMVFTYAGNSGSHSHAFSVDRVIIDMVNYVPLRITRKEERKRKREEKKADIEKRKREATIELFEVLYSRKWIEVKSTNLLGVYYAPNCKDLKIIFKSNTRKTYVYHSVEIEVFAGLLGASSKGKYFNEVIKGNYMWEVE